MAVNEQVRVTVTADTRQYQTSMKQAAASTTGVEKASAGMAASVARSAAMYAASGVTTAAAYKALKSTVTAATELQDSTSKVGVIFGETAKQITDFAEDSTKSFGLTRTAALDAASTFAVFGKSAGLAGNDLATFSTELTQRAVDLKSFYGGTVEDAVTAVGAALRGEMEPIRRYGVLLDDATLRQRALEMGLVSTTKNALTPQTRALAAANEVLGQTTDAMGDYQRTQDGAANTVNDFNVAVGRLKETMGTELLPMFTDATRSGADMIDMLSQADAKVKDSTNGIAGLFSFGGASIGGTARRALGELGIGANEAADGAYRLTTEGQRAAASIDIFGARARAAQGDVAGLADATRTAIDAMNAMIDAQQSAIGARRDLLGAEDRIRAGMRNTATSAGSAARAIEAANEVEAASNDKAIASLRKKHKAEEEAEIAAARRRAQRRAEARADKQARDSVQKNVAGAIATDKAARRGEDIDGNNQTGQVGEVAGVMTKADQKALESRIDSIRAKHKKALDQQVKGLQEQAKASRSVSTAASSAGGSVEYFSTSLNRNTAEGRQNLDVLDSEVDRIQAVGEAVYEAALKDGKGAEVAGKMAQDAMLKARGELLATYDQLGFNIERVEEYLRKIGLAKKDIKTTFTLEMNVSKALSSLATVRAKITANKALAAELAREIPLDSPARDFLPRNTGRRGGGGYFASGGEIGGSGGTTSDSVPIWASRGEFVINASQYAANRELVKAINSGSGRVAAGGLNIGAINVTEATPSGVRVSVLDALAESAYRSGAVR